MYLKYFKSFESDLPALSSLSEVANDQVREDVALGSKLYNRFYILYESALAATVSAQPENSKLSLLKSISEKLQEENVSESDINELSESFTSFSYELIQVKGKVGSAISRLKDIELYDGNDAHKYFARKILTSQDSLNDLMILVNENISECELICNEHLVYLKKLFAISKSFEDFALKAKAAFDTYLASSFAFSAPQISPLIFQREVSWVIYQILGLIVSGGLGYLFSVGAGPFAPLLFFLGSFVGEFIWQLVMKKKEMEIADKRADEALEKVAKSLEQQREVAKLLKDFKNKIDEMFQDIRSIYEPVNPIARGSKKYVIERLKEQSELIKEHLSCVEILENQVTSAFDDCDELPSYEEISKHQELFKIILSRSDMRAHPKHQYCNNSSKEVFALYADHNKPVKCRLNEQLGEDELSAKKAHMDVLQVHYYLRNSTERVGFEKLKEIMGVSDLDGLLELYFHLHLEKGTPVQEIIDEIKGLNIFSDKVIENKFKDASTSVSCFQKLIANNR